MVSVIIPTYNRGYIIKKSIESILKQTYKNLELIIVDDNSTDDTKAVVEGFQDKRVKYVRLEANKGACYARNLGVKLSSGKYIAFQDSDDIWHEDKLEKQKEFIESHNLDVVGCRMAIHLEEGINIFPRSVELTRENIYLENFMSTQLIFGKRECFIEEKFDERLPRFQDWELVIRLVNKYKVKILDDVLVDTYIQNNSITKSPQKAVEALQIFIEKHAINNKTEANYLRLMGIYKLQYKDGYKKCFKEAFKKDRMNKKVIIDYILSLLGLEKIHYNLYKKSGRF